MNTKYLVIVAAMTDMVVGATALASTDSAFAGKKKAYMIYTIIFSAVWNR